MKRWILLLFAVLLSSFVSAQNILFHENFEAPSQGDSVTSSGTPNPWSVNTRIFAQGAACDSNYVQASDTSWLTTAAFSCVGYPNVILKFSHICKIELTDAGEVEVSVNGGPWTKLTGTQYLNPGNSQFVTNGNKFTAATYVVPNVWDYLVSNSKPVNSWWMPEQFDISALAGNQPNVRVRFALRDGTNNGANYQHGWFIDNIIVSGAAGELIPPAITLKAPVIQDTISSNGPYNIYAYIRDASGIDTAYLEYQINSGTAQFVPMSWVSDSTWVGVIPSLTYNVRGDYKIHATDNSPMHNLATGTNTWFWVKRPPAVAIVGTGTSNQATIPAHGNYNYSWGAMIYQASELNFNGAIDSIAFYVASVTSPYTMNNQKIWIGHTAATTQSTAQPDTSTMVLAYSGSITLNGTGWYRMKLQNAFTYNGVSNLVVYWVNKDGSYATGYPYWRYTTTSAYLAAYKYSDTYSTVFPTSAGTQTYSRPNIRIAYAAQLKTEDAGVTQITQPSGTTTSGIPVDVKVNIKNFGTDTLEKVTIKWRLDAVDQPDFLWTGMVPEAVTATSITIGQVTLTNGPHTIKAWTYLPNDSTDQNHANDTARVNLYGCTSALAGNYTIGSGGDYPTFNAALTSLVNCGISAPVTFNVISGTYTEQMNIPEIPGSSLSNTVTFTSQTGNRNDVTLQYSATASTDNYVVKLNGADNIRFTNMTLKAQGASYAAVVVVDNNALRNIFNGNKITAPVTTATSTDAALLYGPSGSTSDSLNTYSNNLFENGAYGVYIYGPSTLEKGLVLSGNTFTNQYYRAIYLYYQNAPVVNANVITTNSAYGTFYGMYINYCDNAMRITKNKINLINGGYGIYIYYCDGVSGKEGLTANNMISIGGTNSTYGLSHYYSSYQRAYYNSVYIYANAATARAYYLTGSSTYLYHYIKNNIFSYKGTNTAGIAAYIGSTTSVTYMDYNDLYSTGTNLGYWGANRANLAAWQTASLKDSNSVSLNPQFNTLTDLHTFSINVLDKGKPVAEVTDDIDGDVRSATVPDLGADEFSLLAYDVAIDSLISPVTSCALTANENIGVRLRNMGTNPMTNIDMYYVLNNGTPVHEVYAGPLAAGATYNYIFTTQANLAAYGNYQLKIYLTHASDLNAGNDSIPNYRFYNGWDFTTPYTQGFEPTEVYSDWSVYSANGDAYTYQIPYNSTTYSHSGANSARYYNGSANTGSDWLFSRCFPLVAGNTYKISFWYRAESTSYPQNVTLKYGQGATAAAMTNTLLTLTGFTNTAHQQAVVQFSPATTGSYNFGWEATSPASIYYHFIDDINISTVPNQEAALVSATKPVTGCGLTATEPVMIHIKNTGAQNISGNLTAYYQVNGSAPVSEAIANTIIPGDTLHYTFTAPLNMLVASHDSTYVIKTWIALLSDPIHSNDTLVKTVKSLHTPVSPVTTGDTVIFGSSAMLTAISTDTIRWYPDNVSNLYLHQGSVFNTPMLFDTTTYYAQSMTFMPGGYNIVGTGTSTSSSAPLYGYYNYSWSSQLYTAAEIGFTGRIDTIGFYVGTSMSPGLWNNQTIFMSINPSATFANANMPDTTTMTRIYKGSVSVGGPGWYKIGLQTPYIYGGTGNLEVTWINNDGSYLSTYPAFRYTTTTGNKMKYNNLDANFPATAGTLSTSRPNIYLGHDQIACTSPRIPVTAYVIIPQEDISLISILDPTDKCSTGLENVRLEFKNNGVDTINHPFTLGYIISGNPVPVTEVVNYVMLPGDTIIHTFATAASMPVLAGDSTYSLTVYGQNSGDIYFANDTLRKSVTLKFTPPMAAGINDTVPYGTAATLGAISSYNINWYDVPTGGALLDTGAYFTTPVLWGDQTYYAESFDGSGNAFVGPADNTIGSGGAVNYTTYFEVFDVLNPSGVNIKSVDMYPGVGPGAAYTMVVQNSASTVIATYSGVTTVASGLKETVPCNFVVPSGTGYKLGFTTMPNLYRNTAGATYPYTVPGQISITGNTFSGYPQYYYYVYNWKIGSGTGCAAERVAVNAVVTGQPDIDAGVVDILDPVSPVALGTHNVSAVVRNFGLDTLTTVNINWSVNGVLQTPFVYNGFLTTGQKDTVVIGSYNFVYKPYPGLNEVTAWTSLPNAQNDTITVNDTSSVMIDAHLPYNGAYTLGTSPTPDFPNFTIAALALKDWGISGPVDISVASGTYNEQVVMDSIPGASATNTITFASATANNTDVVLEFAGATTTANYVLKLNGADYLHFEDMTIRSTTSGTYGRVLELINGAKYNYFERNVIQSIVSTSSSACPVYSGSATADNFNRFIDNDILNGYYGIYFYGSSSVKKQGNHFDGNNITGWYYYGLYAYYNDSVLVRNNVFVNGTNATTNYHIYLYYCDNASRAEKNRIESNATGSFYGIYAYYNNSSATVPNVIANNFISHTGSTGTAYGIYLYYSNYVNVYFNSVNMNGGSTSSSRAFYQSSGTSNIVVKNNNLANMAGGYAYYNGGTTAISASDYNNLYTNGTALAYWSADRATLAALQAASLKDANSKSVNPGFFSTTDLHCYSIDLFHAGTPITGITTDIDGDVRNLTQPCIGADEFTPPQNDAGVIAVVGPVSPVSSGPQPVIVNIRNFGLDTLTTVSVTFDVDGIQSAPFTWNGSLLSGAVASNVQIGTYSFATGVSTIRAWTSNPNGSPDPQTINDTAEVSVVGCNGALAGTYTIGSGAADFASFNEANLALHYCGVSGPVIFNVAAGNYVEQLHIKPVTGASALNTITFQSASGLNTDVSLKYAATGTNDNYVVFLDSANYFQFRNITIESSTSSTYGKVVVMAGGASFNKFEGNIIRSVVTTSTNAAAVYASSGAKERGNTFNNNKIENGYYGVYFYGSSSQLKTKNVFSNNNLTGYYYYGYYLYYNDSVTVSGNTVVNGSNATTNYPVYLSYCSNGPVVTGNTVIGTSTGSFYGIELYYCTSVAGKPAKVANNFISSANGTGTAYGLYCYYSNYVDMVYNSVNITGGSVSGGRALYVTGGSNVVILNNSLVNTASGYAYYAGSTSAVITSDHNNIYTPTTILAYWGADLASLASLQTASGKDSASISQDPIYTTVTDLHVLSPGLNGLATPFAGVTTDIDGETRSATTPDIGADEYNPMPLDIAVTDFVLPAALHAPVGSNVNVTVTIRNLGSDTVTSFNVYYKYASGLTQSNTWTGVLLPSATVNHAFTVPFAALIGSNNLCAYTVLAGDGNIHNDTLCESITGIPIITVPDSNNFEGANYWYADGPHMLWEFGTPSSSVINSAHSPTHAWKTNLDGTYGASETEYLYSPYYSFTQVTNATLKFWHWYNTEATNDGGKIEYNIGNTTWLTLGYMGDPAGTNWYNTSVGGNYYFTGNSAGWVVSSYNLSTIPAIVNATQPVQFRYKFISNATTQYDGWAIDDFTISSPPLPKDAGVVEVLNPAGTSTTGSNVTLKVRIKNFGSDSLMSVPVSYRINSGAITQSTWTGLLMPGDTTSFSFPTTFVSPGSAYSICAFTKKAGDTYKFNDTTCVTITPSAAALDAGVIALMSPTSTTIFGDSITVSVRIRNFGTSPITSLPVGYSRNGLQIATATWTGTLAAGDSVDYTFTQKYVSPMAFYSLCAYSMLPGDADATNDQKCVYPEGVIGIDEYGMDGFRLWQNVPNPAYGTTTIAYQVPVEGKVVLEVHNLFGQILYSESQQADAGQHTFELDVQSLADGVYYYTVTWQGKRLTKKMVVR
jgi:hypothetical protein